MLVIKFIKENNTFTNYSIAYEKWYEWKPTIIYKIYTNGGIQIVKLDVGDKIAFDENNDVRKYNGRKGEWVF